MVKDGRTSPDDTVVVVAGGADPSEFRSVNLPGYDAPVDVPVPEAGYVIAADSGLGLAYTLGYNPNEVIGDFDSVAATDLERFRASRGIEQNHPEAKDATDLELALAAAAVRLPSRVVVLGSPGGRRPDHSIVNNAVLCSSTWAGFDASTISVEAWLGKMHLTVVRSHSVIHATVPGEVVSLLAMGGFANGLSGTGFLYEVNGSFSPFTSRGSSNEFVTTRATVTVSEGVLLVIRPGEMGTHFLSGLVQTSTHLPS